MKQLRTLIKTLGQSAFLRWDDPFIEKIYTPKGYFTPPYETAHSLEKRLKAMYRKVEVKTVEDMAAFRCRKGGSDGK